MKTTIIKGRTLTNVNGEHNQKNNKTVICLDNGKKWYSTIDCAEELGVHPTAVSSCCLGKTRTCKRFHLAYATDDIVDTLTENIKAKNAIMMEQEAKLRDIKAEVEVQHTQIAELRQDVNDSNAKMKAAILKKRKAKEEYDRITQMLAEAKYNYEMAVIELEMLEEDLYA